MTLLDLGGLVALLLWGVHMVQTGIQRALGPQLRAFLGHRMQNRATAFFAGLGVTALLQSSTATALMVKGFASSGLISLRQGLAVMLGANVGTTLIVQILSFDVALVAPILVLAGYLLFRRGRAGPRDFGRVLIGLGLILLSLHQFLSVLDLLARNEFARTSLQALSEHIVFIVLIGALLAWAAHSSVAIVLLAISFAASGVLSVAAGIALALGANAGTAINPVLEGSTADAAARRLTIGKLIGRLGGVLLILAVYPFVTPLMTGVESAPARAIANFHVGFNLALALILFPLLTPYARLLERLFPSAQIDDAPDAPRFLEPITAETAPAMALAAATREALRLADVLEEMIAGLRAVLAQPDRRRVEETRALDDRLDRLNRAIKENLLAIEAERLNEEESDTLARILTFSINLEQAGDLIDRGLLNMTQRRIKRGVAFSREGIADLLAQADKLHATLRRSTAVFLSGDPIGARALASEKEAFRRLEDEAIAAHFQRLRSGNIDTIETSALHLDALRDLKRVNGHLIEASAYPILKKRGELLASRLRQVI
ncbi:Na/Pi cotransporter family protein [Sphingomonas fennica]|uniref:Na/Pi cotransporter n=1 Tax=Edaphosphingomonas fennica TaxID=114404 RepID=A0A2T4I4Z2_9SPHN|nr:Na/Pi cotransporter family protein [Sphingomonas fennica]PTD24790.1 Na/Pi cotransporter [Sphingomonas fennica]